MARRRIPPGGSCCSHPFLLRLPSTPLWHLEADGEGVKRGGGRAREAHSLGSIVIAGENKAWTQIQHFVLALKSLRFQEMCDIRSSAIKRYNSLLRSMLNPIPAVRISLPPCVCVSTTEQSFSPRPPPPPPSPFSPLYVCTRSLLSQSTKQGPT